MSKRPRPPTVTDAQVRDVLARFACELPFPAVRTRLLGSIASPDPLVTPLRAVEALWGGALPVFDSMEDANELISVLVMGLWNQLSEHQHRSAPFRLTRIEVSATREGVATLALMREQEVWNFGLGLVGSTPAPKFPERADRAMGVLFQVRGIAIGIRERAEDREKDMSTEDCAGLIQQFRDVTKAAEHEIHEAVLACARARRAIMPGAPAGRPVGR